MATSAPPATRLGAAPRAARSRFQAAGAGMQGQNAGGVPVAGM